MMIYHVHALYFASNNSIYNIFKQSFSEITYHPIQQI